MMSKVNLIVINQHNVKLLTPLLTEPQLLSAAGLTYQSGIGLLGFAMIAASEQLFAIQVQQQVVGIILLGRQYDEHGTRSVDGRICCAARVPAAGDCDRGRFAID